MNKYQKIISGAVAAIVIIAGIVFIKDKKDQNTNPIKIGVVYSLTGAASFWSEFGKNGADMAIKEINEKGGINGRPIEI